MVVYEGIREVIDCGQFVFACPPNVGEGWFLAAAQLCGLGTGFRHQAHSGFRATHLPKMSMICHPCDWLAWDYASKGYNGWNRYFRSYVFNPPGHVARIFRAFGAEVVFRYEDLPWAFVQLLESLDVPVHPQVMEIPKSAPDRRMWNRKDRQFVINAEREICDAYGYT